MKKMHLNRIAATGIVALFLFVLSLAPTSAQSEKTWSIGPEIGANFAKFAGDAPDNKFSPGLMAGAHLTYSIINTFGITGKVLFAQRGGKFNQAGTDTKQTLNYVEVPLQARYFLTKSGAFRPNIFLGPSFGFLIGATNKVGSAEATKVPNYKNDYNTFDLGGTVGLGLNYEFAHETRILLDARYTHGFSDVSKGAGTLNNRGIGVTVGLAFGLL